MRRTALVRTCILVGALGCAGPSTNAGDEAAAIAAAREEISEAISTWEGFWRGGDAAAAAAGFTEDAINMRPGAASDVGRAAVEGMARDFLSAVTVTEVSFTTEELDIYGDAAYELGTFLQRYTDGTDEVTQQSRYMAVWKRGDDGSWRYHRFIFNNLPAN